MCIQFSMWWHFTNIIVHWNFNFVLRVAYFFFFFVTFIHLHVLYCIHFCWIQFEMNFFPHNFFTPKSPTGTDVYVKYKEQKTEDWNLSLCVFLFISPFFFFTHVLTVIVILYGCLYVAEAFVVCILFYKCILILTNDIQSNWIAFNWLRWNLTLVRSSITFLCVFNM